MIVLLEFLWNNPEHFSSIIQERTFCISAGYAEILVLVMAA
jgi:hypothetical protein